MINEQRILMFNVSKEKRDKIIQMCKTLGILTKIVDRPQYNQKIGALAEISGFKEDKEKMCIRDRTITDMGIWLYSLEVGPMPITVFHAEDFGC